MRGTLHQMFHLDGITDLSVLRKQATERTKMHNSWGDEEVIIHFHLKGVACASLKHEYFTNGDRHASPAEPAVRNLV